jgi:hypothetical protein
MNHKRLLRGAGLVMVLCGLAACGEAPPDDVCRAETSSETGLEVIGTAEAYFYAHDASGAQIGSQRVNRILTLEPGTYQVRLSGSRQRADIRSGSVTRCTAGELTVTGTTDAYYYVLDTAGVQLASARVGQATALFPGSYLAKLNNSTVPIAVRGGILSEFVAGTLAVTGTTDEYFYVLDTGGTQLASSRLGQPLDLAPGNFLVKVNNATSSTEVTAGQTTTVRSGTVTAVGTTDDYYYVLDTAGTQLGSARLGRASAYLPGVYRLRVTNTDVPVTVVSDEATEVLTGTLIVQGSGSGYYYVLNEEDRQLGSNRLNTRTPLPAGTYSVKLGEQVQRVTITAGETTAITP